LDLALIEKTGPVLDSFEGIHDLHSSMVAKDITELVVTGNSQHQSSKHYVAMQQK
jgi:hypothetical protein